jgi:hypothetical protein
MRQQHPHLQRMRRCHPDQVLLERAEPRTRCSTGGRDLLVIVTEHPSARLLVAIARVWRV